VSKPNILFYPHVKYRAQFFLRYLWPAKQLLKMGYGVKVKDPRIHGEWTEENMMKDFEWADVIVAFYPKTKSGLTLLEVCETMKKKLVVDVDDYAFALHPSNPAYGFAGMKDVDGLWHDGVQYSKVLAYQNHTRWMEVLRCCDALTVTQKYLGDQYGPFVGHHKIWVLPNCLYLPVYKKWERRAPKDRIRIGWQGGASHYEDLQIMEKPMRKILDEFDNVDLVILGAPWKEQQENFPEAEIHPWVDSDTFQLKLGSLDLDIGICPIVDSEFNKGKSNLKMIEYGVYGVPSVCSEIPDGPYNLPPGLDNGKDRVLVGNDEDDWYEALKRFVVDEEYRHQVGDNARMTTESIYNIETQAHLWGDCYEDVHKGILPFSVE
jgi:glycosyltransferase involved in cell wall biosynthesis